MIVEALAQVISSSVFRLDLRAPQEAASFQNSPSPLVGNGRFLGMERSVRSAGAGAGGAADEEAADEAAGAALVVVFRR